MRNNKLSINYTKTKFMLFSTKKTKKFLNINISNHKLEQVNQLNTWVSYLMISSHGNPISNIRAQNYPVALGNY